MARVELDRAFEGSQGLLRSLAHLVHLAHRNVRLSGIRRQRERAVDSSLCLVTEGPNQVLVPEREMRDHARQPGMRGSEVRIQPDRLAEHLGGRALLCIFLLARQLPAAQVEVVGREVRGAAPLQALVVGAEQRDAQCLHRAACNLLLNRENVLQLPVERLGPQMGAVGRAHQLRRDAHAISRLADAAVEHRAHVQQATDLAPVDDAVLELERARPGGDAQAAHGIQRVDDFFRRALAEVILVPGRTHVGEGQHCNGRIGRGRGCRVRNRAGCGLPIRRRGPRLASARVEAPGDRDGDEEPEEDRDDQQPEQWCRPGHRLEHRGSHLDQCPADCHVGHRSSRGAAVDHGTPPALQRRIVLGLWWDRVHPCMGTLAFGES